MNVVFISFGAETKTKFNIQHPKVCPSYPGLEEFEEKIDKIAEGEDDGENSWISKIYNQFSFFNDGENSLEENDMDGLEPPLLDETWGLGVRTHNQGMASFIMYN